MSKLSQKTDLSAKFTDEEIELIKDEARRYAHAYYQSHKEQKAAANKRYYLKKARERMASNGET